MIKVNAFTTGISAPSARYRVRQNIPFLENKGVEVNEIISKAGGFPPSDSRKEQVSWLLRNITENSFKVLNQPTADVTWLQKVMLSKHYTFERFLKKPLVFDVDDAIFLKNGGVFAQKIAGISERVICGNQFLANYFEKYNPNIDIIPTAVDVSKYDEIQKEKQDTLYILWTGTSSGYPFVYEIEQALKIIVDKYNFVKIKIVSNAKPNFKFLKENDYSFEYWSTKIEFSSIKNSDIGIMPLHNSDQARGKCSYKMLCYMAAKLPVVVSPVGMNNEVLNLGKVGFGASTIDEWVDTLSALIDSNNYREEFSQDAYRVVKENFDIEIISSKLEETFKKMISH